jgi:hypothetical protein
VDVQQLCTAAALDCQRSRREPAAAARSALEGAWATLSDDDRLRLATVGLAALIADALAEEHRRQLEADRAERERVLREQEGRRQKEHARQAQDEERARLERQQRGGWSAGSLRKRRPGPAC